MSTGTNELPEMPSSVETALVAGPQGSEYRRLSVEWDPNTARHSEAQLRARDRQIVELCAKVFEELHPSEWGFAATAIRSLLQSQK